MFPGELKFKIEQLEIQLAHKEEEYTRAIKARQNHKTLRSLREEIYDLKEALKSLYDLLN